MSSRRVHPSRLLIGPAIGILFALAACVPYRAAPIDPAQNEARFGARSLEDPSLAAWASTAIGADSWGRPRSFPPARWDLDSLALAAFWFHPDIDVARAQAATARAAVRTASTHPNPVFAFRPEYVLNPVGSDSSWVADLGLDLPVETGGKRDLRAERARKLALAAEVATYETAWRVRSGVRKALLEHLFALHELDLLRAELEPRREALDLLRRRFAAGEAARPDVARAEIERSRTEVETRAAETHVAASRAALAAAIGVPSAALESLSFNGLGKWNVSRWEVGEPPVELPLATVREPGLLERFDVRRALLEYDAAEADVRLEIARQYPDLTLGPGYIYDQGLRKLAFNFSLPLPLLDRNQGPIAEAEARRSEAQARFTALQARAIGEIDASLARYRGAQAELAEARVLSGQQRETEQALRRALAAGSASRLDVALARAEIAALARVELLALRRAEEALGDLENALERPLEDDAPVPDVLPERPEKP